MEDVDPWAPPRRAARCPRVLRCGEAAHLRSGWPRREGRQVVSEPVTAGDWDNIHQWNGAFKDEQALKDAYAAGTAAHTECPTPRINIGAGRLRRWMACPSCLQAASSSAGRGAGGPLIDPNIPNQTLMFAITTELNGAALFFSYLKAPGRRPAGRFDMPLETFFQRPGSDRIDLERRRRTTWMDITASAPYLMISALFEGGGCRLRRHPSSRTDSFFAKARM